VVKKFKNKKARCEQRAYIIINISKGYRMACFTATTDVLRHDQLYILLCFINTKIYKNLKIQQKAIRFLQFILFF